MSEHERLSDDELTALERHYARLLHDPEIYDPRAGGFVLLGGNDTADLVRDGQRLLAEVRALRAEVGRLREAATEIGVAHLGAERRAEVLPALAEHLAQSHTKCNICGRLAALAPPAGGG